VRVAFGVLARYAEVDPESGLINLTGGGIDVFGVANLPVQLAMPFVLQLRYHEAEVGQLRRITMQVLDPELKAIGQAASFEITPKVGEYHATGWQGIFAVAGEALLMADSPGVHSVQIRIDGEVAGDIPFQVVLAPEA
jgi:hypothetical protein